MVNSPCERGLGDARSGSGICLPFVRPARSARTDFRSVYGFSLELGVTKSFRLVSARALALAAPGALHQQDGRDGRGHEQEQADQPFVDDRPVLQQAGDHGGGQGDAEHAHRHAHGRGMDALVKAAQPQQADGDGPGHDDRQDKQQGNWHGVANWQSDHGSITSPRSRNFARAEEPTKPNNAISRATSKYRPAPKRRPSTSRISMPLM